MEEKTHAMYRRLRGRPEELSVDRPVAETSA